MRVGSGPLRNSEGTNGAAAAVQTGLSAKSQ
jgi:hypothetical protein